MTLSGMDRDPAERMREAQTAVRGISSAVVSAGDPRKVEVTCLATGEIQGIRIATTYSSKAAADELGATLRDTLRAAQEAAAERRAEVSVQVLGSLEDLSATLTRSLSTFTNKLNEIGSNLDRLTYRGQ